jgi:hypothetical protein
MDQAQHHLHLRAKGEFFQIRPNRKTIPESVACQTSLVSATHRLTSQKANSRFLRALRLALHRS